MQELCYKKVIATGYLFSKYITFDTKKRSAKVTLIKLLKVNQISAVYRKIKEIPQIKWKIFYCIPVDLLIVKLHACRLSLGTVTSLNSNLKDRKQSVRISNIFSAFQNILSGVRLYIRSDPFQYISQRPIFIH